MRVRFEADSTIADFRGCYDYSKWFDCTAGAKAIERRWAWQAQRR